jgi:hypothetical protein
MGPASAPEAVGPSSPDAYREFIRHLELEAVWLKACHIENHFGPRMPPSPTVAIASTAQWTPTEGGFEAVSRFTVTITFEESAGATQQSEAATIEVSFGLRFRSGVSITEALFDVFRDANLPVNSWPYLREFLSTTSGRFGWQPFTLPVLKRGVPPLKSDKTSEGPAGKRENSPEQH